ncbi:kynureninase [Microbacterium album]|uniref:Kynureninase n=1 Tax=Microbacterium album TaxID=2053191 RepID=A0A917IF59_9MICO|nr:kynureninase [Microbacterium album]GGH43138.1 kynureninase [Microbacterium album]
MTFPDTVSVADALDARDPLASFRSRFVAADDPSIVYLDGNSLGRPVRALEERMSEFVAQDWGRRLIRGWDEGWFEQPVTLGDRLGRLVLGAGPGQTAVGDSTTVCLYKLIRSALDARPGRREIVVDRGNFPTDRYVAQGIAAETGAVLRWIDPDPDTGVTVDDVRAAVGDDTAVVVLSHVAFRSGYVADVAAITEAVHAAGGLVVWDLCHSVGVLPIELDEWGVDYATGCTYKYLNGGPGSPAFLYVRRELLAAPHAVAQPIQGWMGVRDSFRMGPDYEAAEGIRRFISGTPPILAMTPMIATLDLIEEAGIAAIRRKSVELTEYAVELIDERLTWLGVRLSSPRDATRRGGHVTIDHEAFPGLIDRLWCRGILPDFRPPTGIRIGLSPLSTSFREVDTAIAAIAEELAAKIDERSA